MENCTSKPAQASPGLSKHIAELVSLADGAALCTVGLRLLLRRVRDEVVSTSMIFPCDLRRALNTGTGSGTDGRIDFSDCACEEQVSKLNVCNTKITYQQKENGVKKNQR